jgi:hypothetical protein
MFKKMVVSGLLLGMLMGAPTNANCASKTNEPTIAQLLEAAEAFRQEVISHSWKHVWKNGQVEYLSPEQMSEHIVSFGAYRGAPGWIDFDKGCFRGTVKANITLNAWPYPVTVKGTVTIDNWTVMSINEIEIQSRVLDNGVYYRDDDPNY